MNKKLALFVVSLVLVISATACNETTFTGRRLRGNGVLVEETREIGSFNQLELSGLGRIYVEFGSEESLRIEAEENLIDLIETDTFGKRLEIGFDDRYSIEPTEDITFYLTVVSLESVSISGLGNIFLPEIETDSFKIYISGAGDVNIDELIADRLEAHLSGLGDVDIFDGEVRFQEVLISGSGTYSSRGMLSSEAEVLVSGLGSATITVEDYLDARISGAGDINYYGSPNIDVDISGLGSLNARNE